ncbi:MAG: DUF2878 domain-containing protein [Gammaproteobacteria bacterium]|nr:DUF2878 domain-containing protein [Gammaproteobacteria bacterium]
MNRWRWLQLFSFQIFWLTAVLGRNQWLPVLLFLLLLHFLFTPTRINDLKILILAFLGIAVDGSLLLLGVFKFSQPPVWLAALWLAFVLSIGHSFVYLRRLKLYWIAALGAVCGSYAYFISWKLGAVELPLGPMPSSFVVAILWAILLPTLVKTDLWIREGP